MYYLQVQIYWLILQICRLRSYTSKTVSVWPRSYVVQDVIQELCILFSTTFNFIIFFSHKILVTYFLHRTKSFVLNRTSRKFCTLYFFICQRHKTVNEFRQCGDNNCTQSKRERLICGYGNSVQCLNQTWIHC